MTKMLRRPILDRLRGQPLPPGELGFCLPVKTPPSQLREKEIPENLKWMLCCSRPGKNDSDVSKNRSDMPEDTEFLALKCTLYEDTGGKYPVINFLIDQYKGTVLISGKKRLLETVLDDGPVDRHKKIELSF